MTAPDVREGILSTVQALDHAVRNRDLDGVLRLFSQKDAIIFAGSEAGETCKGLQQLRELFSRIFSGPITFGFHWDQVEVNVIDDVAWLFATGRVETISAAGFHDHPYRITGILRRTPTGWLWIHYHGSEPAG